MTIENLTILYTGGLPASALHPERFGGDMASTWVAKPAVHAEVRLPRKSIAKLIVANDDNYALAA